MSDDLKLVKELKAAGYNVSADNLYLKTAYNKVYSAIAALSVQLL